MLQKTIFTTGPFSTNSYLLWDIDSNVGACIDAAPDSFLEIYPYCMKKRIRIVELLITHGHWDHVADADTFKKQTGTRIQIHLDEKVLLSTPISRGDSLENLVSPDHWLSDGEKIPLGEHELEVLHTPGHTPGHVCFFDPLEKNLYSGDVLFRGSIGRTDLPYGDFHQLRESISTRLLPLDPSVRVYPGHGPSTTLGTERLHNPFLIDLE